MNVAESLFSKSKAWWVFLLWPFLLCLSQLYRILTATRHKAYKAGVLKAKRLGVPVICVGNITVGGTGKTPLVVHLAETLVSMGHRPAILSRGYKRQKLEDRRQKTEEGNENHSRCLVVSDGKSVLTGWKNAGDEPYLLAEKLLNIGVPVVVGINRYIAGKEAMALGTDCIIMDDGFQHFGLCRDLDMVTVDATNPIGNGYLLPAGQLREPAAALRRAGMVVITKCNLVQAGQLEQMRKLISQIHPAATVVETSYATLFKENYTENYLPDNWISGRKVVALSGIANPESFESGLYRLGAKEVVPVRYGDHHFYTQDELEYVARLAGERNAPVVTTVKDAVRLPEKFSCVVAEIKVCIINGEEEWQKKFLTIF